MNTETVPMQTLARRRRSGYQPSASALGSHTQTAGVPEGRRDPVSAPKSPTTTPTSRLVYHLGANSDNIQTIPIDCGKNPDYSGGNITHLAPIANPIRPHCLEHPIGVGQHRSQQAPVPPTVHFQPRGLCWA